MDEPILYFDRDLTFRIASVIVSAWCEEYRKLFDPEGKHFLKSVQEELNLIPWIEELICNEVFKYWEELKANQDQEPSPGDKPASPAGAGLPETAPS